MPQGDINKNAEFSTKKIVKVTKGQIWSGSISKRSCHQAIKYFVLKISYLYHKQHMDMVGTVGPPLSKHLCATYITKVFR